MHKELYNRLPWKPNQTKLRIVRPSLEHSRGSPEFPNQNLMQIGQEVLDIEEIQEKTEKQRLLLIFID